MGSPSRLALLVTLFALAASAASAASASDYPACWWSGLPPSKPNITQTRCLDAEEYTCCDDCSDKRYALIEASTDGRIILNQMSEGLGDRFNGTNMMMCATFAGFASCQFHLEQFACATGCSPDAGRFFVKDKAGLRVMQVCNDYAQKVYSDCKGLSLAGLATLDRFFPTAERFMEDLFGKVGAAFGVYNYTVGVVPGLDKCFNGPNKVPKLPICCDPLPVPDNCPANVMNFTEFPDMKKYINREIKDRECGLLTDDILIEIARNVTTNNATIVGVPSNGSGSAPAGSNSTTTTKGGFVGAGMQGGAATLLSLLLALLVVIMG